MSKFILTGSMPGHANNITINKSYEHLDGFCFYDDAGNPRNIGPYAWKPDNNIINPDAVGSPMNQYVESQEPTVMDGLYDENVKNLDEAEHALSQPCTVTRQYIIESSKCFGTQEDGSHYTDMQLQPLQACYLRYGLEGLRASIHTKVDKYISRKKNDDVVQLKKAAHCMSILAEIAELEQE